MKTRKLTFLICVALMFSILSSMAFATSPEVTTPGDDPVDPEPYNYINFITMALDISSAGKSTDYCKVYVPDHTCTCDVQLDLERKLPGADWSTATVCKTWNNSGSGTVVIDKDWYVDYGYIYRLAASVDVYTSAGLLGDSTTVYSNIVSYS